MIDEFTLDPIRDFVVDALRAAGANLAGKGPRHHEVEFVYEGAVVTLMVVARGVVDAPPAPVGND